MLRRALLWLSLAATIGGAIAQAVAAVPAPADVVTLSMSPVMVPPGSPVVAHITSEASLAGSTIALQVSSTTWTTVATITMPPSGAADLSFVAPSSLGTRTYRAVLYLAPTAAIGLESRTATVAVVDHGPGNARDHAFEQTYAGRAVRWNPCHAIRLRENVTKASSQARADLAEALRRVTLLTGIRFSYVGTTTQPTSSGRFVYPSDTDLIISWMSPSDTSFPRAGQADVEGVTSPEGRYVRGVPRWMHAGVMINADATTRLAYGFGRGPTLGGVLLHELGHALGLGHTGARDEVMYPEVQGDAVAAIYGAGDAAGLRLLGRAAGCLR